MNMNLLEQFRRYLDNQLTNELVEEPTIDVQYTHVGEESYYVTARGENGKDYSFEYNAYFITEEGTALYEFEPLS